MTVHHGTSAPAHPGDRRRAAAGAARPGRAHRRGDHRRGAQLLRRAHRARWARPSGWPWRRPSAASSSSPRAPAARPRRRRPSTAPTSSAAARRAAGARSTRCSRRTGSARGSRGASCRPRPSARASTPTTLARFAALVFAYIEQLSAASLAGHTDELENTGRVRQRLLERLARAPPRRLARRGGRRGGRAGGVARAEDADGGRRPGVAGASGAGQPLRRDAPGGRGPAARGRRGRGGAARAQRARPRASRAAARASPTAAPSRVRPGRGSGWASRSTGPCGYDASGSARTASSTSSTWCSAPTPAALADLRERVLAPLAELGDTSAQKLTETLRSWLLHHGRREAVAAELFVHPQTVRYRMGQLREVFGDRLEDPDDDPRADDRAGAASGSRVPC